MLRVSHRKNPCSLALPKYIVLQSGYFGVVDMWVKTQASRFQIFWTAAQGLCGTIGPVASILFLAAEP